MRAVAEEPRGINVAEESAARNLQAQNEGCSLGT